MLLTRLEIADHVSNAFQSPLVSKSDLLAAAQGNRAPEQVMAVLRSLPEAQFRSVRELWQHLPDVPRAD